MLKEHPINYPAYRNNVFNNRFITHEAVKSVILKTGLPFKKEHVGYSAQGRDIFKISAGSGKTAVLLWSQMHGNEPTGTLAFLDLFNFLAADDEHNSIREQLLKKCTLHFVPMLNPDGAEVYTRRNAQGIDINRDFLQQLTPEGRLLIKLHREIIPEFGFNMHDQETLWSVTGQRKPAAISLLAPPADDAASTTACRLKAIQIISGLSTMLADRIPGFVGRWSEEFEPRAFGDNLQRLGTSTILVEAGGYLGDDERQYVRELNFHILIHALLQIATEEYKMHSTGAYYGIPQNNKEIFHILIKDCIIETPAGMIRTDIGLNYEEKFDLNIQAASRYYTVADIGDLSPFGAYNIINADGAPAKGAIVLDALADFKIVANEKALAWFECGTLK